MSIDENEIFDSENEELFEHFRFVVDNGQKLLRIDKYLFNRLEGKSRNKIQQAADAGSILVNDKPIKSNYKVKPNDVISIVLDHPPRELEIIAENIPVNIIFEDDDLIVVNKEAGMVVHPGHGNYTGTLVNALTYHFENLPKVKSEFPRPGLLHRIDKNTTGILVVAKNEFALTKLAKDFYDRNIERRYVALVWGDIKDNEGTIIGNTGRSLKDRKIRCVFPNGDFGKHSVTHYKVIERFNYLTLVECKLETGRTHQIRVHFQYIGHPLFNDNEYGGDRILKGTTFTKYKQFVQNCFDILPRQALHAKSLGFTHPVTGKKMFFDSELPDDMTQVLEKWRRYSNSQQPISS